MRMQLNDYILLEIFKFLNLNERANLRLCNKRFRSLCDSILVNKLIIYEKLPPVSGTLKQIAGTNEHYHLIDTVEVRNLAKFFKNKIILNQMRNVEKLVVYGLNPVSIEINNCFTKLSYLMLSNVLLKNSSQILKSTQIQHLILDHAYFRSTLELAELVQRNSKTNQFYSIPMYGFDSIVQKNQIKYLCLKSVVEHEFVIYCVENHLFDSLEELDVHFKDLASINYLNKNCASLKRISCLVGEDVMRFYMKIQDLSFNLVELADKLRCDLEVYLFGVLFNKQTLDSIMGISINI